jgi:hypothetical protein
MSWFIVFPLGLRTVGFMVAMPATVSTVEEVHQWTREQQQIRQDTKEMGRVLGHEEEPTNGKEGE